MQDHGQLAGDCDLIVAADREIDDPTDFPWPHLASVLRDLKAIAGDIPMDLNRVGQLFGCFVSQVLRALP